MDDQQIEAILLIGTILCAVAYWLTIITLVAFNSKSLWIWNIALAAALIWPVLALMSFMQLVVVSPILTLFAVHGFDMSKPIRWRTIWICLIPAALFLGVVWTIVSFSAN